MSDQKTLPFAWVLCTCMIASMASACPAGAGEAGTEQKDAVLDREVRLYTYLEIMFDSKDKAAAFLAKPEVFQRDASVRRVQLVEGQMGVDMVKQLDAVADGNLTQMLDYDDGYYYRVLLRISVKTCPLRDTYVGREIIENREYWARLADARRVLNEKERKLLEECKKALASSPNPREREEAARKLGWQVAHVEVLPVLKAALGRPGESDDVKDRAVRSIGLVRSPESIDLLIELLESADERVRAGAGNRLWVAFLRHFRELEKSGKSGEVEERLRRPKEGASAKDYAEEWRAWWRQRRDKVSPSWDGLGSTVF